MPIKIEVRNCPAGANVDLESLQQAVAAVLRGEGIENATISLAIVDDATIHRLNKRYLNHDYATDVLSFVLEESDDQLEGEVIISIDTANSQAKEYGWLASEELTLYAVHGTLHLVGYDDLDEEGRAEMRRLEADYLKSVGIEVPKE